MKRDYHSSHSRRFPDWSFAKQSFLVSTNNNVADGLISTHFGANANAIVVIRDEESKETEANSRIPVANLVNVSKIIGVISCGDENQLW